MPDPYERIWLVPMPSSLLQCLFRTVFHQSSDYWLWWLRESYQNCNNRNVVGLMVDHRESVGCMCSLIPKVFGMRLRMAPVQSMVNWEFARGESEDRHEASF